MNAPLNLSPTDLALAAIPDHVFMAPVTSIDEWLAMREGDVTASNAAALFGDGVHPYVSALELWARKTGLRPPQPQSPAMRRGQLMEPVILQMLREDYPDWRFEQANRYYSDPLARIGATPDFYATRPDMPGFGVIDAKSVGKFAFKKGWRDADGDLAVPMWIAIQVTVTAALCGASWGAVAPLQMGDGGLDLSLEDIPLRPAVMPRLAELVEDFWRRVRKKEAYPPDWNRDVGLIASLYNGEEGPPLDWGSDEEVLKLLDEREALKLREADASAAAKERKLIDAKLMLRLGNASAATVDDGRTVSVKIIRKKSYTVAAAQYPQLSVKAA